MDQRRGLEGCDPFGRALLRMKQRLQRQRAAKEFFGLLRQCVVRRLLGDLGIDAGQFRAEGAGGDRRRLHGRQPRQHGAAFLPERFQRRDFRIG